MWILGLWACSPAFENNKGLLLEHTDSAAPELESESEDQPSNPTTEDSGWGFDSGNGEWVCESDPMAPTHNWQVDRPENQGMDPDLLQLAANYALENHSECLVVARNGYIVGEWYWNGLEPMDRIKSWSVAKSYASTVVGLAIDHGYINGVHDPIGDYIPELVGTDKEFISIHDVLSMTSGVRFNLIEDNLLMAYASDMTARALNNPVENFPGARWEYNNHTVQLAEPLIRHATGMPAHEFAATALWEPIGMDARWEQDDQGHAAMYMNVRATCRDHAKFAYLMLKDGCWDGEQVLSKAWIEQATSPSSPHNRGYGYWWWLNGETPVLDSVDFSTHPDKLHPHAPDDSFCGAGLGSQMLEVIPSEDLVIVRFGPAPHENINFWLEQNGVIMDSLENDGKQIVHNGVLNRVLAAITD